MKIALAQTTIVWEERDKNIENAERLIEANKEAGWFFFPEMSFTGFSMNTALTAEDDRKTVGIMSGIARSHGVGIGFGWVRSAGPMAENVYTIVGPDGSVVSEYAKIHPFSFSGEDRKFCGGDKISVFELEGIPFSSFICYDLRFPELFREVAKSVHAVVVPACWPAKRSEHWKTLIRARAIEDQVYILGVNCCGDIGGLYYSGDSCVIDPNGEIKASLSDKEGAVIYELTDDADSFRRRFPVLDDIKDDYGRFLG
ncbi:MAG: carbon-nitrogen family hydrolase [Lachnospiraceae bacterium]|nr:carbon-nitrogen family hydrolase [Lachnospiraceae bacterium]